MWCGEPGDAALRFQTVPSHCCCDLKMADSGRSSAMLSSNERVSAVNEGRVSMPWRLRLYLAVEAAVRAAMAAAAARVMAGGAGPAGGRLDTLDTTVK